MQSSFVTFTAAPGVRRVVPLVARLAGARAVGAVRGAAPPRVARARGPSSRRRPGSPGRAPRGRGRGGRRRAWAWGGAPREAGPLRSFTSTGRRGRLGARAAGAASRRSACGAHTPARARPTPAHRRVRKLAGRRSWGMLHPRVIAPGSACGRGRRDRARGAAVARGPNRRRVDRVPGERRRARRARSRASRCRPSLASRRSPPPARVAWRVAVEGDLLRIREIRFEGLSRVTPEELLELSPVPPRRPPAPLRTSDAVAAALRRHPWIAVGRGPARAPGRARGARRRAARARRSSTSAGSTSWTSGARSSSGRRPGDGLDLPVVTGIDARGLGRAARGGGAAALRPRSRSLARWAERGLDRRAPVSEIHLDPDYGTTLWAGDDGLEVRLGHGDLPEKLAAARARPLGGRRRGAARGGAAPRQPPAPGLGGRAAGGDEGADDRHGRSTGAAWRRRRPRGPLGGRSATRELARRWYMAKTGDILVGLDIGTTKICAIVGEVTDEGIDIIGIGSHPSKGLRKGVVVNIDATVASIKRAIEEAEHMAGCEITTVYTGIAGGHIKAFPSHGVVAVKDKEVRQQDIDRVIDQAKAVAIPLDREVIHVLPAGVRRRRPGRHEGAARHERRPPRGEGPHRHRRGLLRAEHREVRAAHRPQRRRHRAPAARLVARDALRGREGARRVPRRHRRRHDRHRHLPQRLHPAHRGHLARRQPPHERHRRRAAHADARGRADQEAVRLRARRDGRQGRDDRGAERRRRPAARPLAPHPRRDHRAARRGDLHARAARAPEVRAARRSSPPAS